MIELPSHLVPNGASPSIVDRGGVLRGASAIRIDRAGSHYRIAISHPPYRSDDDGRIVVSRLIRAKRRGLRVPYPLLSVDQGQCGSDVVVDGADQAGEMLAVRGLPGGVEVREGYWMSIEAASGQHYLHNIGAGTIADDEGRAVLDVSDTGLRHPFGDGDRVHLVRPMIEGLIEGDQQAWALSLAHHVAIEYVIEEAA
jgi:hypothetical protein